MHRFIVSDLKAESPCSCEPVAAQDLLYSRGSRYHELL